MKVPKIDERFLTHRLRSTSYAGMAGAVVAVGLFEYRYFAQHRLDGALLAVACTMVAVKLALMVWYHFTD